MSSLYGWAGKILRIDLSGGHIWTVDTEKYALKYIGGKGLMHRLAWEEIRPSTGAFDPENRLMITTGPLTGTPAPTSGRVEIGGVAAQSYPEMYSHSGIGGWLGPELKYAGYDAVIIQGKAPAHSYIFIENQNVSIKDASYLWGMGTYDCQQELKRIHGREVRSLVIGPAGENLSRIAVLMSENANAAGQGGFGGVAGSKNLKAICIKGSGSIKIARSKDLLSLRSRVTKRPAQNPLVTQGLFEFFGHTVENIPWEKYYVACSHSCDRFCMPAFKNIPRSSRPGLHSNEIGCIGNMSVGWQHSDTWEDKPVVEWPLWSVDLERGTEVIELLNQYGINQYEVLGGMMPWIVMAAHEGLFSQKDFGFPIDPDRADWWVRFLGMIAYREGIGDLLAEGTTRAINALGREKYSQTIYTGHRGFGPVERPTPVSLQQAWGYAAHSSGRGISSTVPFPHWLITALTWMTQTRDSNNDTHHRSRLEWTQEFEKDPYRSEIGPWMTIWNENRSELKCSLTLCDWAFPMAYFTSAESGLFTAVTGMDTSEKTLDTIGERSKNLQRAVLIRNYGRSRETEVSEILPFFRRPDGSGGKTIDEQEFARLVDNYYRLRGWDRATGWPTRSKLEELDLVDVADELEGIGKLPGVASG